MLSAILLIRRISSVKRCTKDLIELLISQFVAISNSSWGFKIRPCSALRIEVRISFALTAAKEIPFS